MPGMSGLEVQEELKRRGQAIPVIFITGQKDEEIRKQAFSQGAVKFLYKPFSDSALLEAVNAALSRSPSENCFLKAASAAENRIVNTARQVRPMKLGAMLGEGLPERSPHFMSGLSWSFLARSIAEPM
jgi:FixJ family two-component response regulator